MKTIWTLLFLATAAVTFSLALMFVPESGRTDKFWLAIGAIAFGEFAVWIAFTFPSTARGEQAGAHARGTMVVSTVIYFCATLVLGGVALAAVSFKVLLALHMLALLMFIFLGGLSAIGTRALQATNEANQPRP